MMNDDQTAVKGNPLGYAPIMGLIQKFAIPSIISMLVNAAYNITDQIFIGHVVGMLGNAATNVAFPVVTFTIAFAQLAGVGIAANFNISLGAKKEEEAKKYLGTGLMLMVILSILMGGLVRRMFFLMRSFIWESRPLAYRSCCSPMRPVC